MILTPGQPVLVLDIMHKPAGSGIVQIYHEETGRCQVLFQYPHQSQPESIAIPTYRLIPQLSNTRTTA
jgi:hypothetical protein